MKEHTSPTIHVNIGTYREPIWKQVCPPLPPNPFEAPPSLEKGQSSTPKRDHFVWLVNSWFHAGVLGSTSTSIYLIYTNRNMYGGAGWDVLPNLCVVAIVSLGAFCWNIYNYCKYR